MSIKLNLVGLGCGLLLATSALAQSGGGAGAQPPQPQSRASCLALDEQGRTIPNPNASYGCFQLEAQRADCEALAKAGNTKGLSLHCFGFDNVAEVQPAPTAPVQYSSAKRR